MKNYNLAYNTIGLNDYKVMERFLKKRKYLNQSVYTKNFENKFSKFLGTRNSVFVNSGSSANLLMAQVLLEGSFLKIKLLYYQRYPGLLQLVLLYSWDIK